MKRLMVTMVAATAAVFTAFADTETIDGYTWTYRIDGDMAAIYGIRNIHGTMEPCISPSPIGAVTIPSTLGGKPVRHIESLAFWDCSGLTSVTIPNSVTYIEDDAFQNCSGLTSVTMPDSVTHIGSGAFRGCRGLADENGFVIVRNVLYGYYGDNSSVAIPDGVMGIGSGAFMDCSGLTDLSIPDSVREIGEDAFYGCYALFDTTTTPGVKLVDGWAVGCDDDFYGDLNIVGVRGVADLAFAYCDQLTGVTIGNMVTRVGAGAFSGCGNLTSVTIGDSVTSIGEYAFFECSELTSVTIGNNVTNIGEYAFAECGVLGGAVMNVTIPDSVTSIGECAFEFSNLMSVTIPDSVKNIGHRAFGGCSDLVSISVDVGNPCYSSTNGLLLSKDGKVLVQGVNGDVVIPDGVERIGNDAFASCELTSVTIPDSVTNIGDNAFASCSELTSVTIPDSVTNIGDYAFYGCSGLTSVTIPDSVTNIGHWAFYDCDGLTSVTIPDSVTSIGDGAFEQCDGLVSISVDAGNSCYSSTNGLLLSKDGTLLVSVPGGMTGSLSLPDGVTCIGGGAASGCGGLTSVVIPDGVTSIGSFAFDNCFALRSVTLPESVTNIGWGAFSECGSLMDITLPKHITCIGPSVFAHCGGLTNVTIEAGATSIGNHAFFKCMGLTSVTIPNSVTNIGEDAFASCASLSSVMIGDGVMCIEAGAFGWCERLTSVSLPKSLEGKVDASVFVDSPNVVITYRETPSSEPLYTFFTGYKMTVNVGLKGYTAKGLPSGLKYDSKKGTVSGAAKKATAADGVTVTFTKKGKPAVKAIVVVRKEVVSAGCDGLADGTFAAGMRRSGTIPLEISTESGVKSVSVTGLPPGMKFDSKKRVITGFPTKGGNYTVTVKVTGKTGVAKMVKIAVHVDALPTFATGTFQGFAETESGKTYGAFTLTAAGTGALTAKIVGASKTYSFSKSGWDAEEDGVYVAELTTKAGDRLSLRVESTAAWDAQQATGTLTPAAGDAAGVSAQRRAFGKTWQFSATGDAQSGWTLAYAAASSSANLTVSLGADGVTKLAGKLGGYSISATGYANVGDLKNGVLVADFAPVVTVGKGKTAKKLQFVVRTNLWFDRSDEHDEIGSAYIQQ